MSASGRSHDRRYAAAMGVLADAIDELAVDTGFSGRGARRPRGEHRAGRAYGMAHRGLGVENTVDTRFAVASVTKGLTALTVVSLIEDGTLDRSTTARSVLAEDLPLIDDRVTVEHLLAHRSGIGDYVDEDEDHEITEHLLAVPVHELATTEDYLAALGGFPTKFAPDERFSYCNSGYVVLALIAERAAGTPFAELVHERVCGPAGMVDTAFDRSDELAGRAALGYLPIDGVDRTNVFHIPVRGSGDGGIYTTAADLHRLWSAAARGTIVSPSAFADMIRPRSDVPEEAKRYGLGFWLAPSGPAVMLIGYDAGVSAQTVHDPTTGLTSTVIANTSDGAWPMARLLSER